MKAHWIVLFAALILCIALSPAASFGGPPSPAEIRAEEQGLENDAAPTGAPSQRTLSLQGRQVDLLRPVADPESLLPGVEVNGRV